MVVESGEKYNCAEIKLQKYCTFKAPSRLVVN